MADALGIIGVIGVAGQILQLTVKFGLDWKDAPEDARSFRREIQTLRTVLSETHCNILLDEDFKTAFEGRRSALLPEPGDPGHPTSISSLINTCKEQLEDVLIDLKKRIDGHRLGWERLKGAFTAKKTRETVHDLQLRCQSFNTLIGIDTLALGVQIHKTVKLARQEQNDWQNEQRSREILDWLSKDDYEAQQSDFLRRRQEGTGQWLLDSLEYQHWVATPQTALFCPGFPGAGKTMLTAIVVDDLQTRFDDDEDASIAYLYCEFRRQQEQTAENLLSSILRQLSQDQPSLPECVQTLHDKHKSKSRPSLNQLSTALRTLGNLIPRVYIVIDALDECQLSDGSRNRFLSTIFDMQSAFKANVFATSRNTTDVTDRFAEAISVNVRAHEADLRRHLEGSISELPTCVKNSTALQEDIIEKIIQAADGMFLLAQLHFDSLKGKTTIKSIKTTLGALHAGSNAYDKKYEEAMERIDRQYEDQKKLAMQVLMWITCAMRPVRTFELREALAVEVGETKIDPENVPELEDIVSVCAWLVIVDEKSKIIRLVHYTTQEYFSRNSDRWFPNAHCQIAETCVTYLSLDMFSDHQVSVGDNLYDRLQPDMILLYAFQFWDDHASLPESELCNHLVSKFFQLSFSDKYFGPIVSKLLSKRLESHLHRWIILVGRDGIVVAASKGNTRRVQYLLDRGAWPNCFGRQGSTPLVSAVFKGHADTVRLLLNSHGIDVNKRNRHGDAPLHAACACGSNSIINMLLDAKGIGLKVLNNYGDTILHRASSHGLHDMVRMLLRLDASNLNARNSHGETALHSAAQRGSGAVVNALLVSDGIEVNSKNPKARSETPLHYAAYRGHKAVVRILLDFDGIDVNARTVRAETPLHLAASQGHESVARMLANADGTKSNARDSTTMTPLHLAAFRGHKSVVRTLLEVDGVDILATTYLLETPSYLAALSGRESIARMLLEAEGIELDGKDTRWSKPYCKAVLERHRPPDHLSRGSGIDSNGAAMSRSLST